MIFLEDKLVSLLVEVLVEVLGSFLLHLGAPWMELLRDQYKSWSDYGTSTMHATVFTQHRLKGPKWRRSQMLDARVYTWDIYNIYIYIYI